MPAASSIPHSQPPAWTNERIRDLVQRRLNKRPCWYQLEVAKAFFAGQDVIGCAPTGAGKTLSFWIPLLMAQEEGTKKILFVVSPLNVLAKQNVDELLAVGISAVAVSAENAMLDTFKDIERGKYEVVVTNPEILITSDELRVLWKTSSFTRQILGFVFDEGHCIVQWGKFRKHYLAVGILRYLVTDPVPFYVASATLPSPLIAEIRKLLHMSPETTAEILCSNERPDISLVVRPLSYPSSSYKDLSFLVPHNWDETMNIPRKFLVFFDNIKEAEGAKEFFHRHLLKKYHSKLAWFHSTMSQEYREAKVEEFRRGELWGLFCTDAFGLGMDIGDVEIVVQYKATCNLCTLWQRFGRAARSPTIQGVGILLVEKKDTNLGRKGDSVPSKRRKEDSQLGPHKRQRRSNCSVSQSTIGTEEGNVMDVDSNCQSTLPSVDTCSEATWLLDRQARYAKRDVVPHDPTNAKKGRAPGALPGSAMDDYINLPPYVTCRRLVSQLYFGNKDTISDGHLRCDPAATRGCGRCRPSDKILCCDICHPQSFDEYDTRDIHLKMATSSRRSVIPLSHTRNSVHSIIQDAIYTWRKKKAVDNFGEGLVRRLGAQIFMTEDVVDRILACWSLGKLTELSHLSRETEWPQESIQNHGQSLLDLLAAHPPLNDQLKVAPLLSLSSPEVIHTIADHSSHTYPTPWNVATPLAAPFVPVSYPVPPPFVPVSYPVPAPFVPSPYPVPTLVPVSTYLSTSFISSSYPVPTLIPTHLSTQPKGIVTPMYPVPNLLHRFNRSAASSSRDNIKVESSVTAAVVPRPTRKRAPVRCGNCFQVGHNCVSTHHN